MRIVSINTGRNAGDYVRRLPVLAARLAELSPDIVCAQEVFRSEDGQFDTATDLGRVLAMPVAHVPARPKARNVLGHGPVMSTSGLAVASRWPIVTATSLELPTSPADGGRSAQIVEIEAPVGRLRIVNVHFSFLDPPEGEALRVAQWAALAPWRDGRLPTIVAGDFNAAPESSLIRHLAADPTIDLGPDDLAAAPPTSLGGLLDYDSRGAVVDYVLALKPALSITSRTTALAEIDPVLGTAPSDHAAVVVELRAGAPGITTRNA
jgi:endonuclease/exonuclease/phosphatase family metal-dependent hydrolase